MINLTQSACNCNNFPRIWYCKHIAAIYVHFPQLCPKESSPSIIPECVHVPDLPQCDHAPRLEEESAEIVLRDINVLCQQLSTVSDRSSLDLKTLKAIKHSLKSAIASANRSRALPEKDNFNPNQKTWAETAEHMGFSKAPKCKHSPVSGNTSSAEQCIGAAKGKHHKYTDLYAGGKRSGKHTKPDVVSTTANTLAHTAMPAPAVPVSAVLPPLRVSPSTVAAGSTVHSLTFANPSGAVPHAYPLSSGRPRPGFAPHAATVLSPARVLPSAAAAGSAAHSFALTYPSGAVPHAYPPSSGVPGLVFVPFSAALPRRAFVPPSVTSTGFGNVGKTTQTSFWAEFMPGNALVRVCLPLGLDLAPKEHMF